VILANVETEACLSRSGFAGINLQHAVLEIESAQPFFHWLLVPHLQVKKAALLGFLRGAFATCPALRLETLSTAVTPAWFCTFTRNVRQPCSMSSRPRRAFRHFHSAFRLMTTPTRQCTSRMA